MAIDRKDFDVFDRYRDAGAHAFSNGIVTEADKDSYDRVFKLLRGAVDDAIAVSPAPDQLTTWNCRFGRDGGIQGQRPVDLWASIINAESEDFSRFPQVYAIASPRGIEVGFSITIHEDNYYNQEVKRKNRSIVPIINAKLPAADSTVIQKIASALEQEDGWQYGLSTRQGANGSFVDLPALVAHLRSPMSTNRGGGAIYRIVSFDQVGDDDNRIAEELSHTLAVFWPLMQLLRPSTTELSLIRDLLVVAEQSEAITPYDPESDEDGRRKLLREVAVRLGQGKFRDQLIEAYAGRCAITGCDVLHVLQAAHISPWQGKDSNHVSNGLLLRADLHTLFDFGLLRIDPVAKTVIVSDRLAGTEYAQLAGSKIAAPAKPSHHPSMAALKKKFSLHG